MTMPRWMALAVTGAVLLPAAGLTAQPTGRVGLISVDGAIGPAAAGYVSRAVDHAAARDFGCLVVQLNTPGGLLDSTQVIVQTFFASKVPVVVYVAPEGATAGSAGVFITMAADVAAMAPTTSIGAAHPVMIGGAPGDESKPAENETMKQKLVNYATSYIEAIAAKRHRNVEWARQAVRESAAVTADKALALNVIDVIAKDLPDLLRQLDGRTVNGRPLKTSQAEVVEIRMTAGERVFQLLWRPEVMFILMLIAVYGIIGELGNPGAILPGVAGVIALILALYLGAILPVNIAGIALFVVALALFAADVFAPTHGVLTVGGVIALFLSGLMLFDRAEPAFRLSLGLIIPATVLTALFFLFVVGAGLRAQRLPVRLGHHTLLGRTTAALSRIDVQGGQVFVEGEYWRATSAVPIETGQPVEIVSVDGLTLTVKPTHH
jgi:membrane-bound serine protease (ClpP class)